MEDVSIWNDTFTVSLKELHRLVLEERRHGRSSVNFYNFNGEWLKKISY